MWSPNMNTVWSPSIPFLVLSWGTLTFQASKMQNPWGVAHGRCWSFTLIGTLQKCHAITIDTKWETLQYNAQFLPAEHFGAAGRRTLNMEPSWRTYKDMANIGYQVETKQDNISHKAYIYRIY